MWSSASKSVLVVGGGPAGMEAARDAALLGHEVTLWERSKRLGGQMSLAAKPAKSEEWGSFAIWLTAQLEALQVDVELGKHARRGGEDV